jgi:membrane associated rhomboid family serine protease
MATATQTCYRHPNRETGVSCSSCGRPICPDCMTPTPVGMRCPECSKQKTQVKTLSSMTAAPTVTMALIAINVIVFLASGQFGFGNAAHGTQVFFKGALDGPDIHYGHDYWRLVTGGFLHVSIIHIGFNMYLLYMLGQMLEPVLGNVKFGLIYFTSLLAGSFGALALNPTTITVGASGAVFGLMGAAFFELRSRGFDPFAGGIQSIGGLIVINLLFSLALSNVSIGGHIGGLIGGSLCAVAMHEANRRRQPLLGYAAMLVIAVASVAGALAVAGNTQSILG